MASAHPATPKLPIAPLRNNSANGKATSFTVRSRSYLEPTSPNFRVAISRRAVRTARPSGREVPTAYRRSPRRSTWSRRRGGRGIACGFPNRRCKTMPFDSGALSPALLVSLQGNFYPARTHTVKIGTHVWLTAKDVYVTHVSPFPCTGGHYL